MPSKLPDNLKSLVIQDWLSGKQRDKIAVDNGLSAGAVTNTVNEWRLALGFSAADGLRELAVTLKKIGISPAQCALGFRTAITMNRLGVKEDDIDIKSTYQKLRSPIFPMRYPAVWERGIPWNGS